RCVFIKDRGVIEDIDNLFFDDFLQIGKIDDHSKLDVSIICDGRADNRDRQLITVPVNIPAFAIVASERMAGFGAELVGKPDFTDTPSFCRYTNYYILVAICFVQRKSSIFACALGDELIWLERLPGRQGVTGSNPVFATKKAAS